MSYHTSSPNGDRIPFDRALEFANNKKITELLYPLFIYDIGALLYQSSDQASQGNTMDLDRAHPIPIPSTSASSANLDRGPSGGLPGVIRVETPTLQPRQYILFEK